MLGNYYQLIKPGIVYGNLLSATAGFLLAAHKNIDWVLLFIALLGIGLVIASACTLNNYFDRAIDANMERTKKRVLVSGEISITAALTYGVILGFIGFTILLFGTNQLTLLIGIIGYFAYIVVYGIAKRRSVYGTIIGSVSGSMPLIAGYTAVSNRFDGGALILFLIMTFWQMPHFYAIAIYRINDYRSAKLPVWPIIKDLQSTKYQILLFIILFIIAAAGLTLFGYTGLTFLILTGLSGSYWLYKGLTGLRTKNNNRWAHMMFGRSLFVLLCLSFSLALNAWVP